MIDNKEELKDRVKAKQRELQSRYHELKADSRAEARQESGKIRRKLDELQETMKEGWDDLTESVTAKLNEWLK